jgi:general secretion pathway protein A
MEESQAHLSLFGLREQPFAPTADPVYFYATREHKECLFRLWNSIDARQGIAVVLGSYGTGKTTLLRKLLIGMRADPGRYNTAVIGSPIPSWTSFALLESIVTQFGLRPAAVSFVAYMEALNRYLLENRESINTLIIDDAQNLNKRGQIELLRLVQNLESQQHKLLNLVLFAQMEWTQVLRAAPNFEQRIDLTYTLEPIRFEETRHFIAYRLQQAGATPDKGPEFTESALRAIHAYTEGNPRVIVTLCRNTLLVAAQIRSRKIGHEAVLHTIEKTTLPDAEKRARVAAAVMEGMRQPAQEAAPEQPGAASPPAVNLPPTSTVPQGIPAAPPPPRGEQSGKARELRATELLLRAARARQGSE